MGLTVKFTKADKLLTVSGDAKTKKGEKAGVLTGILYLAPNTISGFQVCPKASPGCILACLYTAGMGVYTNVQLARINRTRWFFLDKASFFSVLVADIERLQRKAAKLGMIPAVRLNGTSDIAWEKFKVLRNGEVHRNIMAAFPEIMFYDYTKILGRKAANDTPNYHLTFSLSEDNDREAKQALKQGLNVAVVMNAKRDDVKPATWGGYPVIDGDVTDIRFTDPKGGTIVALFPKGKASKDSMGFVREKTGGFRA